MSGLEPTSPEDAFSYITPIGYRNSSRCGYCDGRPKDGKQKKRYSYYATTRSLSPDLYQSLIDRCWRRSGSILYRPNQKNACCPHYAIRLDASAFRATKDQRQAINRFNRYVIGDAYSKAADRLSPRSREEAKRRETTFDITERVHEAESHKLASLQPVHTVHGKKMQNITPPGGTNASIQPPTSEPATAIEPAHRFEVTLETDEYSDEKFYIFENYQRVVHKETASSITKNGFTEFLCGSPLRRETVSEHNGREKKLGSFHQCYRIDGRLVAVGVLDLLPHAVSAVYFFYHETLHGHNPGKLSAMREISLAIEGGYMWWYSGYYIHSCPKMRYKIDFAPQYVLDPETYQWDLLDKEALVVFDQKSYVSLSRERRQAARDAAGGEPKKHIGDHENSNETGNELDESSLDSSHDLKLESNDQNSNGSNEDDTKGPGTLFTSGMPGLPPRDDIAQYDLSSVAIRTSQFPEPFPVNYLTSWPSSNIFDGNSIESALGELVAIMGIDLAPEICLDFRRL